MDGQDHLFENRFSSRKLQDVDCRIEIRSTLPSLMACTSDRSRFLELDRLQLEVDLEDICKSDARGAGVTPCHV
eukprot:750292-Hanusia_phi.AAC.2